MIRTGQLVRIESFHRWDVFSDAPERAQRLIGQTGRFTKIEEQGQLNLVAGEFVYEPDPMNQNCQRPYFAAVYVHPLED